LVSAERLAFDRHSTLQRCHHKREGCPRKKSVLKDRSLVLQPLPVQLFALSSSVLQAFWNLLFSQSDIAVAGSALIGL